ncbi:hypothetical protein F4809DRAFT_643284 [Biscogniauxia mediterranea]|nr:hypothetical protein F4809DRAFT_643284 [Biscogniauxia mediterranea]
MKDSTPGNMNNPLDEDMVDHEASWDVYSIRRDVCLASGHFVAAPHSLISLACTDILRDRDNSFDYEVIWSGFGYAWSGRHLFGFFEQDGEHRLRTAPKSVQLVRVTEKRGLLLMPLFSPFPPVSDQAELTTSVSLAYLRGDVCLVVTRPSIDSSPGTQLRRSTWQHALECDDPSAWALDDRGGAVGGAGGRLRLQDFANRRRHRGSELPSQWTGVGGAHVIDLKYDRPGRYERVLL